MGEDGNCTECLVASLPSVIVLLSDQQMSLVMGDMKAVSVKKELPQHLYSSVTWERDG